MTRAAGMRRATIELVDHGGDALPAELFAPESRADEDELRTGVVLLGASDPQAEALALAGFVVLAPDLVARERAAGGPIPDEPPDRRALADVDAALARLADDAGVDPERIAVVGCGAGGTLAFLSGCHSDRPAAVVSLGGRVVRDALSERHPMQPLEMALNLGCPFLGLYADEDPGLPAGELEHVRAVLSQFARSFDIVSLPGSGPDLHPGGAAGRAAWGRVADFLREWLV